jgi:hypothetical protein
MPTDTELEIRLRRDLRARRAAAPPAPADLADRVRRRHRSQRRAQVLAAVAAVAVVAGSAGAATLVTRIQAGPAPDTIDRPSISPEDTVLGWPTRGSLAGDEEWLDGLRRLDWELPPGTPGEVAVPAAPDRHVAYAGEVPAGAPNGEGELFDGTPDATVALVVGEADGRVVAAWFTGNPGATPEEMELAAPPQVVDPAAPLAYMGPADTTPPTLARVAVARVVVAAPDASLERSTGPVVDADGTETLQYVPVPATDGAYADVLHRYDVVQASEVRSRPSTGQAAQTVPAVVALEEPAVWHVSPGEQLTEQYVLGQTLDHIMGRYNLQGEANPQPRTLITGDAADGHRAALVGLTFPSGATGAWLVDYTLVTDGWRSSVGRLPHAPAGTPLEERLIGVPVGEERIALHAPPGAVRADVLTDEGTVLGTVDLADGGYVGPVPGGSFSGTDGAARVRALDASGRTVAEGPIDRVVDE